MPPALAVTEDMERTLREAGQRAGSAFVDRLEEIFKGFHERHRLTGSTDELGNQLRAANSNSREFVNPHRHRSSLAARAFLAEAVTTHSRGSMKAVDVVQKNWPGDQDALALVETISSDRGGNLLEEVVRDEVYEELIPGVALLSLGLKPTPMPEAALTVPGISSFAMGNYVGETQGHQGTTENKTESRKLTEKKYQVSYGISNTYIEAAKRGQATSRIVETILQGVIRKARATVDFHLMLGKGGNHSPKGLWNWARHQANWGGALELKNVLGFFGFLMSHIEEHNIAKESIATLMSARFKSYLMTSCLDGDSRPFLASQMVNKELLGHPFATSTWIPSNLGETGNHTEVMVAALAHVIYGERPGIKITSSSEGAYTDSATGQVRSCVDDDVTVTWVSMGHDITVENEECCIVGAGVPIGDWTGNFNLQLREAA